MTKNEMLSSVASTAEILANYYEIGRACRERV